jgi:hypothetical protein
MKLLVFVLILLVPRLAIAQESAEVLFQEGMRLIDGGNVEEGCDKLAASYHAEPGFGVLFNLADCHERLGRTATAWGEFHEALGLARQENQAERQDKALRRIQALETKLSTVKIQVSGPSKTLVIRRNYQRVNWSFPVPVDPGEHLFSASDQGKKPWSIKIKIATGPSVTVITVPVLESVETRTAKDSSLGGQRIAALAVGGVGVASLALGGIFGVVAKNTYDSASSYCQGNQCLQDGLDRRSQAYGQATASTILFIAGGAALAGGGVLWLTAKKTRVGMTSNGFVAQGVW